MIDLKNFKSAVLGGSVKPDMIAPSGAPPAEAATVSIGDGSKSADITKDITKVPEGLKIGGSSFVIREGTEVLPVGIVNEKNPIIHGGGEKFVLGSTTPIKPLPKPEE